MAEKYKVDQILEDTSIVETAKMLGIRVVRGKAHCISGKHTDKEPSMLIYERNKRWTCRACGATGRTLDMVRNVAGLDFQESCEWLIRNFNLNRDNYVENTTHSKINPKITSNSRVFKYMKPDELKAIGIINTPVRGITKMFPEDAYATDTSVERDVDCCIKKELITRSPLQDLFEEDPEAYEFLIRSCSKGKRFRIVLASKMSKLSRAFLNRKEIRTHLSTLYNDCKNVEKMMLAANKPYKPSRKAG